MKESLPQDENPHDVDLQKDVEMLLESVDTGYVREVDATALRDLCIGNSSRHGMSAFLNDSVERFVHKHGLAMKEIPKWLPSHSQIPQLPPDHPWRRVAIAKKETIENALKEILDSIKVSEITESMRRLYQQIKDLPVVEAIEFLDQYPRLPDGNMEVPEVAAIEGLVFGYKPCDIEYYLRTRYLGIPEHAYEDEVNEKVEYVMCEECAKKWLLEKEKSEDKGVLT
ncbi:MAG: hypothetical protein HYW37_00575 [Candidatus Colwellbacteria bacterium]|nr:hypothetical protein [Candidatus Colwellbacteria bacterium]